ncbi:MAG: TVP38/TMEM64 family protein [Peptoniphilaceae bacterium]
MALFKKFEKKTQKRAENNAADTSVMKAQFKKVQIVAVISFAIALIAIFLSVKEHVTIESLTAGVEGNSARAAGFLWLLFAIKSLSVVIPLPSLYLASGLLFQPVKAVCISYVGLAITLTIPYILGRWAGGEGIDYITANYPKIEKVLEFQKKNEFFANFIVRLIGWFPCDILSFYFGASKTPYITYLTASLIGCSIGVVTNTLLGDVILNPLSKPFILLMLIKIAISAAAIAAVYFLNKGKSDGKSED